MECVMKPSDKVKVKLDPRADGVLPDLPEDLSRAMRDANWTADPGTGRAILLSDGSELLNPVPFEPPVDYKPQESIMDMIDRRLKERLAQLSGDTVLDDNEQDANDFDIPDDVDPLSVYEVVTMMEDFPGRDPNSGGPGAQPPAPPAAEEPIPVPDDPPSGGNS